jgi:sugar phosphate isomerase/epimerase
LSQAIDGFGHLCERAAKQGLWVDLEFMPFWGVPDLGSAWAIVGAAAQNNSGILIDTWHFARTKIDLDLLASIPGKHFAGVQVGDATKIVRGDTLLDDRTRYCEFPGEGEMPIIEMLRAIAAKGHLRHIGPEIYSDAADELSPVDAGRKSGFTLANVLKAANIG